MKRIDIKSLQVQVANQIREMIARGALNRGQKVVERNLCAAMGVSRTPVREALRTLNSEGLIDLIPNKGAFVSHPDMKKIKDMFEVMSVLEGVCARLATERMTIESFKELESMHQELERQYEIKNHEGYLRVNRRYHLYLQQLTENSVFPEVINGLRQKILLYRHQQLYQPERFEQSIQEHRDLLSAFRNRNAIAAENVMKDHLTKQYYALAQILDPKDRPKK